MTLELDGYKQVHKVPRDVRQKLDSGEMVLFQKAPKPSQKSVFVIKISSFGFDVFYEGFKKDLEKKDLYFSYSQDVNDALHFADRVSAERTLVNIGSKSNPEIVEMFL